MKKICILLLVFLLCGCSNAQTVTVNAQNFESEVHLSFSGNDYTVKAKFLNGNAEFLTVEPKNLKDFTLCFEDGNVTAKYKKLTYNPNTDFLPDGNAVKILYNILNEANGKTAKSKGETYQIKGETQGIEYTLTVSPSGVPLSLKAGDITAEFFETELIG